MKYIPIESLYVALDSIEKNMAKGERRYRMILIELIEARRNLWYRCKELFTDEKIAEQIYRYLCEGLEECENKEMRYGHWANVKISTYGNSSAECSLCGSVVYNNFSNAINYCPNCGAKMINEDEEMSKVSEMEMA